MRQIMLLQCSHGRSAVLFAAPLDMAPQQTQVALVRLKVHVKDWPRRALSPVLLCRLTLYRWRRRRTPERVRTEHLSQSKLKFRVPSSEHQGGLRANPDRRVGLVTGDPKHEPAAAALLCPFPIAPICDQGSSPCRDLIALDRGVCRARAGSDAADDRPRSRRSRAKLHRSERICPRTAWHPQPYAGRIAGSGGGELFSLALSENEDTLRKVGRGSFASPNDTHHAKGWRPVAE
jgi:hypothetical protein